jgi:hypothetical protein
MFLPINKSTVTSTQGAAICNTTNAAKLKNYEKNFTYYPE